MYISSRCFPSSVASNIAHKHTYANVRNLEIKSDTITKINWFPITLFGKRTHFVRKPEIYFGNLKLHFAKVVCCHEHDHQLKFDGTFLLHSAAQI